MSAHINQSDGHVQPVYNPLNRQGGGRTTEALASGALAFVDQMAKPSSWLQHDEIVLFYNSTSHSLFILKWPPRKPARAGMIAERGSRAAPTTTDLADMMARRMLSRSCALQFVRLFVVSVQKHFQNYHFLLSLDKSN